MLSSSRSTPRRSAPLAGLLLAGCELVGDNAAHETFAFAWSEPAAAIFAVELTGTGAASASLDLVGALANRGAVACPVAIYAHEVEPAPGDIPVLTTAPAPDGPGELLFETVLLPPQGGVPFVRQVGDRDPGESQLRVEFDGSPGAARRWLTIAACAAPDIDLDLEFVLWVYWPARAPAPETARVVRVGP